MSETCRFRTSSRDRARPQPGSTRSSRGQLVKDCQAEYGNGNEWNRIFEANKDILKDPNKIYPGQKLKIPPK
jgi:hypothetical protein